MDSAQIVLRGWVIPNTGLNVSGMQISANTESLEENQYKTFSLPGCETA
jgi:hypothetical protein